MDVKLFLILLALVTIIISYIKYRKKIGQELIIAFIIAIAWTAYFPYKYVSNYDYFIGPINLYPLALWTAGLIILREVYENIQAAPWVKLLYITIIYWFILGLVEAFGYYALGIRSTPSYPSLLGIGILHNPFFAQIFYLTIGPIYLLITDYLKVE